MALSIRINVPEKPQNVTFRLIPSVLDEFKQYVKAAQEEYPDASEDAILEAILMQQFRKDKGFKAWKQAQVAPKTSPEPQHGS